jgi:hypothetical protein
MVLAILDGFLGSYRTDAVVLTSDAGSPPANPR